MVFVFIIEEGPKDLVLDAFGLAFLYNLDDLGGILAFLDEKWDEEFLGKIYGEMKETDHEIECGTGSEAVGKLLDDAVERRQGSCTPDNFYSFVKCIIRAMLVIAPLVYIFVEMKPKEED